MKKILYLLLVIPFFTFSQVGIGTTTPQATLDIQAINSSGTSTVVDGFLAPRVDRQRMQSMVGVLDGTIVYCSSVSTGLAIGATALVDAVGYYFFELGAWQKLGNGAVSNLYTANGTLSGNRTVTQGVNTLAFTSVATTGTSHFTVDGSTFNVDAVNNRVGIGTLFPRGRLHVASEAGGNDAVFSMSSNTFNEKMDLDIYKTRGTLLAPTFIQNGDILGGIRFNGFNGATLGVLAPFSNMADILGISDGPVSPTSAPGLLTFRTTAQNDISPVSRMTIRSNGNVGIGTDVPITFLHINRTGNPSGIVTSFVDGIALTANTSGPGGGFTGPGFYFESLNGTVGQRLMKVNYALNASNEAFINYQAVGDNGSFSVRDVMAIFHNGRVGIGTTNPIHPLQMLSGAHVTVAGVWTNASDSRLKSDILATNYGLAEVLKLRPVQYTMNIDKSKQVGFIAQEVQKIIPEVVSGIEGDVSKGETLGISYGNLVPVLTNAIQELNKKIEELKLENASLKATRLSNDSLTHEIELLKKEIQSIKVNMNTK